MGEENDVRYEEEVKFCKTFYMMADLVEKMFSRFEKLESAGEKAPEGQGSVLEDDGGDPPPSPLACESSSSSTSHHDHRNTGNTSKKPFFKLNVKFDLPMFNDESNAEKLNNWIRQIEVYCRVQWIEEDEAKIQLTSLRLNDTALV